MFDLYYIIAGALTGFVVGLTGVGGGALMTPILLLVFGVTPINAIATDLWFAAITKIMGAAIHHKSGHVDWQIARRLWLGSLPAAVVMVLIVNLSDGSLKTAWLSEAIGMVVALTGVGLLIAPWLQSKAKSRRISQPLKFKALQPLMTVIAGGVLGSCVATTSIGAGALGGVIMLYLYPLRMTNHRIVATDIVHAIPLAMVAGLGYLAAGMVDYQLLQNLLCGSIPAVIIGSLMANKLSAVWVRRFLGFVLVLAGTKTWLS